MKAYPAYLARLQNATADADWKRFEQTVGAVPQVRAALQASTT